MSADRQGAHRAGHVERARTLREFVTTLEPLSSAALQGYLQRGDFSRWIADVFGDRALAADVHEQERRYMSGIDLDTIPAIVNAIRGRSDLTPDEEDAHAGSVGVAA